MKTFLLANLILLAANWPSTGWGQQDKASYVAKISEIKVRGQSIKGLTNQAEVQRAGGRKWENAGKDMLLYSEDSFRTLEAIAALKFNEALGGGVVKINQHTTIQILPLGATKTRSVFLQVGELGARVKGRFKVKTEQGWAGVIGTEFLIRFLEAGTPRTDLFVFDGTVFLIRGDSTLAVRAPGAAYIMGSNLPVLDPNVNIKEVEKSMKKWTKVVKPNGLGLLKFVPIGMAAVTGGYFLIKPDNDAEVTIKVTWR